MRKFVEKLTGTNFDFIGDIHGEVGALTSLLSRMKYDSNGNHPEERKLVFVGDLVDRGPDSIAVLRLVRHLIEQGNAHMVLGNHELNLICAEKPLSDTLTPKSKPGNRWFFGQTENMIDTAGSNKNLHPPQFQRLADDPARDEITAFLNTLPLVLENDHFRVVHSCWHPKAIDYLKKVDLQNALGENISLQDLDRHFAHTIFNHHGRAEKTVAYQLFKQNEHPLKVVSSGLEEPLLAGEPTYFIGGSWRQLKRTRWWDQYRDQQIVIFGHYWRKMPKNLDATIIPKRRLEGVPESPPPPKIFIEAHNQWLGPKQNCMCIDYSVGRRYYERYFGLKPGDSGCFLSSLRCTLRPTPSEQSSLVLCYDWQLLCDDGMKYELKRKNDNQVTSLGVNH